MVKLKFIMIPNTLIFLNLIYKFLIKLVDQLVFMSNLFLKLNYNIIEIIHPFYIKYISFIFKAIFLIILLIIIILLIVII